MTDAASDADIPLLTEIIAASPTAVSTATTVSTQELQQIRQDVFENVMQSLLKELDPLLHEHLQDQLAVVLDNLAEILKNRVRVSLEQALTLTVEQALAAEMAKFENSKK